MRIVVLLLFGLLAAAGVAEQVTPDALRLLVEYPAGGGVTLVWKNLTQVPLTLEYAGLPITRVTTVDGRDMPMTVIFDVMMVKATLPPGGEKRTPIDPAHYYNLVPGEAYLVTVASQVIEADSGIGYTFPYVVPTEKQAFGSGWTPVEGRRGVEARLNLTLNPKDGRSEARVEIRNTGDSKAEVYDQAMLTAKVRRAGDAAPVAPSSSVKVKMGPLRTLRLPRYATLGLPLYQFDQPEKPLPVGRVAVWLGYNQYVLEPGVRYRIDAGITLPSGSQGLQPFEISLPAPAAPPTEKSPVTVSFQYLADGEVKVVFTNTLDHPLQFTGDVISAAGRFGDVPQSTTSARPPGLWARTAVPAHGEAAFTFEPHQFMLSAGEWYRMTGAWTLRDDVAKRDFAVSATFPYVAPPHGLPFAGPWQPVAGRPGLQVRLFGTLSSALRLTNPVPPWQPTTWVAYRNTGTTAVPVFDFPTLEVTVRTAAGAEVPGRFATETGVPKIEILSLPPGATLTLPASTHALPLDLKSLPENVRYTLDFENILFPLPSNAQYRVEGTVLLPDGEKTVAAPFGRVGIELF